MNAQRLILAGGTGFLGQLLARHLQSRGWEPLVLTRSPDPNAPFPEAVWDGRTVGDWARHLDGAQAVINLAGKSVNCRYNAENRRLIMDSRVDSTRAIGEAIARCAHPPPAWLNASTATIYRHTLGAPHDESSTDFAVTPAVKDEFSVAVARAWEQTLEEASTPGTRKVALRTTLVLGAIEGGVFRILRRLAKAGLGGRMGKGNQFVSWIHEEDFCRAVEWILDHPELNGPVNLAAPHPLTNRDMMATFRRVCRMPLGLPAAEWMLEVGAFFMRTETELLLKSRHVVPGKLLAGGFQFYFPEFESATRDLEERVKTTDKHR